MGIDQQSSPTVPRMIVLRTATLTNMYVLYRREQENSRSFAQVCTLHRFFANREVLRCQPSRIVVRDSPGFRPGQQRPARKPPNVYFVPEFRGNLRFLFFLRKCNKIRRFLCFERCMAAYKCLPVFETFSTLTVPLDTACAVLCTCTL